MLRLEPCQGKRLTCNLVAQTPSCKYIEAPPLFLEVPEGL